MLNKCFFIIFLLAFQIVMTACVTGNDDNSVLGELEASFARTPRVLNLTVDGVTPSRDQTSHWVDFSVSAGQTIRITGEFVAGNGAGSAEFDFSRSYHHTAYDAEDAKPVEPNTDRIINVQAGTTAFDFSYVVPTTDDEGEAFLAGDHINLTWWSSNDLGGQGFMDINLIFN